MKWVGLFLIVITTSVSAAPVQKRFNPDLLIYEIVETIPNPLYLQWFPQKADLGRGDGEQEDLQVIFDQVVNLGKKVWALIVSNKPTLQVNYLYANALPKGIRSSEDLDSFSDLQAKSYRAYGQNLLGMTVYDVTYSLVHRYGGSYEGRGKYLEHVAVIPSKVEVLWGYDLSYSVDKVSTVNTGTRENPVGSIVLETKMTVSTPIKTSETRSLYDFRGDRAEVTVVQP